MGKRELLLLLAFLIAGGVVYQLTTPRPDPAASAPSWSDALRNLRGGLFGSRARAMVVHTLTASVASDTTVVDLGELQGRVEVIGEERDGLDATLRVSLLGESEPEAREAGARLRVDTEERGGRLRLRLSHPDAWRLAGPRRTADVTLRVPRRLNVAAAVRGSLDVRDTGGVEIDTARGDVRLTDLSGPVTGQHRDGGLDIDGAASVDLETRRASLRIARVSGPVEVEGSDGRFVGEGLAGPVRLEVRRMTVEIDDLAGSLDLEGEDGRTQIRRARGGVTADLRRMPLTVSLARPAPLTAELADGSADIELPAAGVSLNLRASDGGIEVPASLGTPVRDGTSERLEATHRGGGPPVKVTALRGRIVVRLPAR